MSVLTVALLILAGAITGFIIGVFVYRNNEKIFAPIADRLDQHEDNLQDMIVRLRDEIKVLSNKVNDLKNKK